MSIERENSAEAIDSLDAATDRAAVLAVIASSDHPVGPSQVAAFMGRSILSIRPRVSNLKKDGIIQAVGRRALPGGTHESVYIVTPAPMRTGQLFLPIAGAA